MNYIEVSIEIPEQKEYLKEVLIAFLAEQSFESFTEQNSTLCAYVPHDKFDANETELLMKAYELSFTYKEIEQQNWNKEWEENYDPIIIKDKLSIVAPFHNESFDTEHTIIIEPKMSFGTGHHATTEMMCELISEYDYDESTVLDMGCGTGVLAIYASILGAETLDAIDIDEWAYENTIENAQRNGITNIQAFRGDVKTIPDRKYDFVFANINLNILKKDISQYAKVMTKGSILMLSGFFASEINQVDEVCNNNGLLFVKSITKDSWIAVVFQMK